MNDVLSWLLGLLDFGPPAPPPTPTPAPVPPAPAPLDPAFRAVALSRINAERWALDRPSLTFEPRLQAAARSHALVMSRAGKLAHAGIGDDDVAERFRLVGYPLGSGAENIAVGATTPAALVAIWMASTPHRANLLGPYADCGLAVAQGAAGPYACLTLGAPPAPESHA